MSSLLSTLRTAPMQLLLWTANPTLMGTLTETTRDAVDSRPDSKDQRSASTVMLRPVVHSTVQDTEVTVTEWATAMLMLVPIVTSLSTVDTSKLSLKKTTKSSLVVEQH